MSQAPFSIRGDCLREISKESIKSPGPFLTLPIDGTVLAVNTHVARMDAPSNQREARLIAYLISRCKPLLYKILQPLYANCSVSKTVCNPDKHALDVIVTP